MVVPDALRWLLSIALAGAALFHAGRVIRPGPDHRRRIAEALHAVMGIAMIVMLWPVSRVVPPTADLIVFAAATGWFAAEAGRAEVHSGRWVPAYFASTAAAMVWMSIAMPTAMPGMDMPAAGPTVWAGAVIGGYLVVAGVGWLGRGLRLHPACGAEAVRWPALCHGVMSMCMGLAALTLI